VCEAQSSAPTKKQTSQSAKHHNVVQTNEAKLAAEKVVEAKKSKESSTKKPNKKTRKGTCGASRR
jgi:hypothetical protein